MCDHDVGTAESPQTPLSSEVVASLVANHREFLKFVERRVGSRAVAEEILQNAFVRSVEKFDTVRESAVGWFYRVLRNAIIDHHRRTGAAERRMESYATDQAANDTRDVELHGVVCKCVADIAETLKPEYATALRRIEIDGVSVKDFADEVGISSSNAGVRVFRAREALRKQVVRSCGTCASHGCLDCTCGGPSRSGD
ncbi:MAG: sigma-70 family RNA polymerase sigma factor [Deltaproteobacteria bacterium]|nr:sigma-70 family RNA polymerase sigma factor [Deltaproteobacteria bacterium]